MPSRCEPASLVKSPITDGGGGVGGLGGENEGGGDWVTERGGCYGGRGCTVVNGVTLRNKMLTHEEVINDCKALGC